MCRSLRYAGLLVPALFVIGCSEKADGPLTGPEFHTVLNTSSGCDVGHISQLANSFFRQPRQQTVKNLVDLLATEALYSAEAKNTGFDIMAQVEGALNDVPSTSGDPAVGSNLLNHLLLCMYNPAPDKELSSYPETFPEDFSVSLTPASHGAFGERSGGSLSPVFSRPVSNPYTGIAPPSGSSWQSIIPASVAPRNDPQRVVFYGSPATPADGQTYDWRSIPHNRDFTSNIIIGFCVDPEAHPTSMVSEKDVAVLAFADAYFLTVGSCSPDLAPLQLARRLLRFGTDILAPRPLMAAVLLTGSGGTKSKCCSKVGPQDVPSAPVKFVPDPPFANVQAGKYFAVQVQATAGGLGVNGDCITLGAVNNNGTNTDLIGAHKCNPSPTAGPSSRTTTVNNIAGIAQFCVQDPKTGTIILVATGNIDNRPDQVSTGKSKKVNVKPSVNVATCTP